jgi:hypothetical protein
VPSPSQPVALQFLTRLSLSMLMLPRWSETSVGPRIWRPPVSSVPLVKVCQGQLSGHERSTGPFRTGTWVQTSPLCQACSCSSCPVLQFTLKFMTLGRNVAYEMKCSQMLTTSGVSNLFAH